MWNFVFISTIAILICSKSIKELFLIPVVLTKSANCCYFISTQHPMNYKIYDLRMISEYCSHKTFVNVLKDGLYQPSKLSKFLAASISGYVKCKPNYNWATKRHNKINLELQVSKIRNRLRKRNHWIKHSNIFSALSANSFLEKKLKLSQKGC